MTINHHPSDALLLDYASGPLGETWSLAIATHLALCPKCRRDLSHMEAMGGNLLDTVSPEPLSEDAFDAVMARVGGPETEYVERRQPVPGNDPKQVLPQPLQGYLGCEFDALPWQRLGLGAYQLLIPTGDEMTTARLLRIPAGRPVPEHTHRGLELTLVLLGAFSDTTGRYGRGDFQEADESLEHQPHAAPGEDCICLAVTDAPLRFKSLAVRIVQPLLGI
jgi:putative transcriptional regulator